MSDDSYKGSRILLVEDEETLAVGLEYNLTEEGYVVKWARNGREAIDYFDKEKFDLIILDIMLPYLNGFEIAEIVRKADPQIPILMLTAKTESGDKVKGLEKGADDYMTKPFHLQELLHRVKGMLKRKSWYKSSTVIQPVYRFGINEINFETLRCRHGKEEIRLTPQEAMLLKYLVEHKGEIVSRKELLENVWHQNPDIETRTVDIFIARLRKYFEPDASEPVYFKSIRGAGYSFEDK
ncbi:MAG: response regulator transcription factor [Ignavibacteriaceae bacterium]|nr:response regulator transcription factor [Ignavibacteriaceae bacterium]